MWLARPLRGMPESRRVPETHRRNGDIERKIYNARDCFRVASNCPSDS